MYSQLHRRRFKKKADSLDISRYGLWGDSPSELLLYIVILLVYVSSGTIISRVQCLTHTHPPSETRVLSGKKFLVPAIELVTTDYPSASLRAIQFIAVHKNLPRPTEIRYVFYTGDQSKRIIVTVEDSANYSSMQLESSVFSLSDREATEININTIVVDSQEVLDIITSSGKVLHECNDNLHLIILELVGPLDQVNTTYIWNITFLTGFYEVAVDTARIDIDTEKESFKIINNP